MLLLTKRLYIILWFKNMSPIDENKKQDKIDEQNDLNSTSQWDKLIEDLQEARAKINEIIK